MAWIYGYNGIWGNGTEVPYTNLHTLNLDWILEKINKFNLDVQNIPNEVKEQLDAALSEIEFDKIIAEYFQTLGVLNVKLPPSGLTPMKGDGVTDDSAAWQAILTHAASNDACIFVPHGSYLLNNFTVPTGIGIYGECQKGTKLFQNGGQTGVFCTLAGENGLRNLTLDCVKYNKTAEVDALHATHSTVDDVAVLNAYTGAEFADDCMVDNLHCADNNEDVLLYGMGNTITTDGVVQDSGIHNTIIDKNTISLERENVVLHPDNAITYRTPVKGKRFDTVPAKDYNGKSYNLMVENEKSNIDKTGELPLNYQFRLLYRGNGALPSGITILNGFMYIAVSRSNLLEKYTLDGTLVTSASATVGHANSMCNDGENIYVCLSDSPGINKFNTNLQFIETLRPDLTSHALAYDADAETFYSVQQEVVTVLNKNFETQRTFILQEPDWYPNNVEYDTTARQDAAFYNGCIVRLYFGWNAIMGFSPIDGSLEFVYGLHNVANGMSAAVEPQGLAIDGSDVYVNFFDYVRTNTISRATICKGNFEIGGNNGDFYAQGNNLLTVTNVYVDPATTNNIVDGTQAHPFKTIAEALSYAKVHNGTGVIINLLGDSDENLYAFGCVNFRILGNNHTVGAMSLQMCTNVDIRQLNFVINEEYNIYIGSCTNVIMNNCNISGSNKTGIEIYRSLVGFYQVNASAVEWTEHLFVLRSNSELKGSAFTTGSTAANCGLIGEGSVYKTASTTASNFTGSGMIGDTLGQVLYNGAPSGFGELSITQTPYSVGLNTIHNMLIVTITYENKPQQSYVINTNKPGTYNLIYNVYSTTETKILLSFLFETNRIRFSDARDMLNNFTTYATMPSIYIKAFRA